MTPFRTLLPTFFKRLFENDLLSEEADVGDALAWIVPLFAAPTMFIALRLFLKYAMLEYVALEQFAVNPTWSDKLFFIGYSMTAVGFITVLVWEAAFPDRRDAAILGALPIGGGSVLAAKLTALCGLILGFATVINIGPSVLFSFAINGYSGTPLTFLRYFFAHATTTIAAGLFVFFVLMATQTTLIFLLPRRALRLATVLAQLVFVVALVLWFALSPYVLERVDMSATWMPPLWFLGLYETLLGAEDTALRALAVTTGIATLGALALAIAGYAASYARIVTEGARSLAPEPPTRGSSRFMRLAFATLVRHPIEQAVFEFVTKSLARSRRHRLILAIYIGVGLAFILGGFLKPLLEEPSSTSSVSELSTALLSIPFVLSFFVLVALRVVFAVPTELGSNWLFQMTESSDKTPYYRGVRKAMALLGLTPIAAATLPVYVILWGASAALAHTAFWLLCAVLLAELLLLGYHEVPFTCAYVPGNANVKLLWPVYLLAMTTYAYTTARLELWLLQEVGRWLAGCACLALLWVIVMLYRKRVAEVSTTFSFRGGLEPEVQVLNLTRSA